MQEAPIVVPKSQRIVSIDLLRGVVMIIMALDHVRDYFHWSAHNYDPLDFAHTSTPIFLTRWITHFCAPVFVFLAGTSAYFVGTRRTKGELSKFLLTRGLWLVLLEITVVGFGWTFDIHFSFIGLLTIWALGMGMIVLSLLIYLPVRVLLAVGLILIFGHNLLDTVHVPGNDLEAFGWSALHDPGFFQLGPFHIFLAYPILSWIGVMTTGYCFGELYTRFDAGQRKKILIRIGIACIILFIAIRFTNMYGDPRVWSEQSTRVFTLLSFINTTKYPPSLLYILMTLGPAILFLAFTERPLNNAGKFISVYGRVPLFYYLLHIYLIHAAAAILSRVEGYSWSRIFTNPFFEPIKSFGYNLLITYGVWMLVVLLLYPLCKRYDDYKLKNKQKWWLSYL